MPLRSKAIRVLVVLAIAVVYLGGVWTGLTEESRRSLIIGTSPPPSADFVIIDITVTSVDVAGRLLNERMTLVPRGRFAIDTTTAATDLKLLINSASGKQTAVFPKGERISPMEFSTLLSGNPGK